MASGALGTAGASLAEVPPGQCPHTLYISQECDLLAGVTRPAASLSPGFSLARPGRPWTSLGFFLSRLTGSHVGLHLAWV